MTEVCAYYDSRPLKTKEWQFDFTVSRKDGGLLSASMVNELWEKFIDLTEMNGVNMGGGFRPVPANELPAD